jgi:hypothetical protein
MMNFVKIKINCMDYKVNGSKVVYLKGSEISEISEHLNRKQNNEFGGYGGVYGATVTMINGNVYHCLESIEEIMSQLSDES